MPVDRGAIDSQLKEIGEGEHWWEVAEFRELSHVLHEGERMLGIAHGKLLGPRRPRVRPQRKWLLVVTDQRLICLQQERYGRKQIDVPATMITGVDQTTKLSGYQITIETTSRRYRLRIPKDQAFRFARALAPLTPSRAPQPFGWIPGMTTVAAMPGVGRLVSGFSSLATSEDVYRADIDRLQTTVERLELDVERLQQQVAFFEDLVRTRHERGPEPHALQAASEPLS